MTPAVGLQRIVDAAEEEGWSVRHAESGIELLKLDGAGRLLAGYAINAKWWCRDLAGNRDAKAFRVTAPTLVELLDLRSALGAV